MNSLSTGPPAKANDESSKSRSSFHLAEEGFERMIAEVEDYAILRLDTNGIISSWNKGAERIKGYLAEEAIGRSFKIFYTVEDNDAGVPETLLGEAVKNGKANHEGWRIKKNGTRFWGSVVITATHDDQGKVIGFLKVTRDLTERKFNEDQLKSFVEQLRAKNEELQKYEDNLKEKALELQIKNDNLEQLNAELSSFVYVISHDLKEPIRKIQIFAGRQLEENRSPEQIKEYSEKIVTSALRMQKLMEALLSYSQISDNPNKPETVDLNEILEAVRGDLEISIAEKNVRIESAKLPVIPGISFQLHQLFLNLLSNSIKFSKESEQPVIRISSHLIPITELPEALIAKNKIYQLITVKDNGVGFEQEYSGKIFDVFQRLDPKPHLKGTGIGLAIVKKVVQNHDGLITAKGKINEGATFRIYLPI